jgi:hypothetical protein
MKHLSKGMFDMMDKLLKNKLQVIDWQRDFMYNKYFSW